MQAPRTRLTNAEIHRHCKPINNTILCSPFCALTPQISYSLRSQVDLRSTTYVLGLFQSPSVPCRLLCRPGVLSNSGFGMEMLFLPFSSRFSKLLLLFPPDSFCLIWYLIITPQWFYLISFLFFFSHCAFASMEEHMLRVPFRLMPLVLEPKGILV